MRYLLAIPLLAAAACAGSVRPLPQPVPEVARSAPPSTRAEANVAIVAASDTAWSRDTAATAKTTADRTAKTTADRTADRTIADEPVTVLPSIIGHARNQSTRSSSVGAASGDEPGQTVRIGLALAQQSVRLAATGSWTLVQSSGATVAKLDGSDAYATLEQRGGDLSITGSDGERQLVRGSITARPADASAALVFNGHRYRGEITVIASGGALTVVNRLPIEDYLRGVVPLEIGTDRSLTEEAAVEAQAIAARSYTYTRLDRARAYDMVATVTDQMYGGMDAERPVSDDAVNATRSMVLRFNGRVVNAPYHANSGGATAAASEVWRSGDEPYLVSVSDRIPGTDHFYCEESPKFSWTRTVERNALTEVLDRYLPRYGGAPSGGVGRLRRVVQTGRTASGRVAGLTFTTDRGSFTVRGNDVRSVLRAPGGELLPSTLFTFETSTDDRGRIVGITIRGTGNGHGVGMDQWGAIARARAGQSYTAILQTYYPGTDIGPVI